MVYVTLSLLCLKMNLEKAKQIINSNEFDGDMRVGFLMAHSAGRVVQRRMQKLEEFILILKEIKNPWDRTSFFDNNVEKVLEE